MSEAKPFASLSSGLLARKGAAKPAMRRPTVQAISGYKSDNGQDDLGWNDMGYDVDPDISNEKSVQKPALNPLAKAVETPKPEVKQQQERIAAQLQVKPDEINFEMPSVLSNKKENQPNVIPSNSNTHNQSVEDDSDEMKLNNISSLSKTTKQSDTEQAIPLNEPAIKKSSVKKEAIKKSKAAFTLRLDPDRHLKLRLACAINNISAQKFVTEALDQKLNEMEEINQLSGQITEKRP